MNKVTELPQHQQQASQTKVDAFDWRQEKGWPTSLMGVATMTKKDKIIFWAREHGLSAASIASRFLRKNDCVSEAFILQTAREAGIALGEYQTKKPDSQKKPDGPVTARIRRLVALGYGVDDIIRITHKKEPVIMRCMIAAQIGGYDDDNYFFIDPNCVSRAAKAFIDVDSGIVDGSCAWCWYQ